jgi:hypothetical protein
LPEKPTLLAPAEVTIAERSNVANTQEAIFPFIIHPRVKARMAHGKSDLLPTNKKSATTYCVEAKSPHRSEVLVQGVESKPFVPITRAGV